LNGEEITLDDQLLGDVINQKLKGTSLNGIRLLSCSDWEGGRLLSKYIDKDLPVYTSNKPVDLYLDADNNITAIDGGDWKKFSKTKEEDFSPTWDNKPNSSGKGNVMRMGNHTFASSAQNLNITLPVQPINGYTRALRGSNIADNVIDNHELILSEKIGNYMGDRIVHPNIRDYPAIDGFYESSGIAVDYKQVNSYKKVIENINGAYKDLVDKNLKAVSGGYEIIRGQRVQLHEWTDIELHIELNFFTFVGV